MRNILSTPIRKFLKLKNFPRQRGTLYSLIFAKRKTGTKKIK